MEEELGFKDISFSGPFFIVFISGIVVAFLLVFAIFVQTFYVLKKSKSKSGENVTTGTRRINTLTEVSQPFQLEQIHLSSFGARPKPGDRVKLIIYCCCRKH